MRLAAAGSGSTNTSSRSQATRVPRFQQRHDVACQSNRSSLLHGAGVLPHRLDDMPHTELIPKGNPLLTSIPLLDALSHGLSGHFQKRTVQSQEAYGFQWPEGFATVEYPGWGGMQYYEPCLKITGKKASAIWS
jgi:hypothetical protein